MAVKHINTRLESLGIDEEERSRVRWPARRH
jgi:hypothetical protein